MKKTLAKIEIEKIIKNGGATLNKSGAAVSFKRGYQVSARDCFILDAENVERIAETVSGLLHEIARGQFVGIWIDGGRAYIDISERIPNKADALRVGKERGQISVYAWSSGACLYC